MSSGYAFATGEYGEGRCPNCANFIALRDDGEIETHYWGNAFQCRGTGRLPDKRTDLHRAEDYISTELSITPDRFNGLLKIYSDEYKRLKEIESTTRALINLRMSGKAIPIIEKAMWDELWVLMYP